MREYEARYECMREKAQGLLLGISRIAGDETVPDSDLEETVLRHVMAALYWTADDASHEGD